MQSVLNRVSYFFVNREEKGNQSGIQRKSYGIIYLVRKQSFPKNQLFLPPDTHTYLCV